MSKKNFKRPEQKHKIINFYDLQEVKEMFPPSIDNLYPHTGIKLNSLSLLIGGTGTGKTNAIMNIIAYSSKARDGVFSKIILVYKTDEKLYEFLKKKIGNSLSLYSYEDLPNCEELEDQMVKPPEERKEYMIIFDDFVADDDTKTVRKLKKYATFGRKKGLTQFYLTQSFYGVDKTMRLQMSYLFLLNVPNKRNLKLILKSYALPCSEEELLEMVNDATSTNLQFFKIALSAAVPSSEKFSIGLLDYYQMEE
jgi:hypothetical protein